MFMTRVECRRLERWHRTWGAEVVNRVDRVCRLRRGRKALRKWQPDCCCASQETSMTEKEKGVCAHPPCNCPVPEGEKYCGAYCEGAEDTSEIICNCGHASCAMRATGGGAV